MGQKHDHFSIILFRFLLLQLSIFKLTHQTQLHTVYDIKCCKLFEIFISNRNIKTYMESSFPILSSHKETIPMNDLHHTEISSKNYNFLTTPMFEIHSDSKNQPVVFESSYETFGKQINNHNSKFS